MAQNSSDLSPVENVWDIMATTVYAVPEPQTLKALECRLRYGIRTVWSDKSCYVSADS